MRSSLKRFFRVLGTSILAALLPAAAAGCSGSSSAQDCAVEIAGDTSETAQLPADCAKLAPPADAGAAYVLTLSASTPDLAQLTIAVPLGDDPSAGDYSSEGLSDWSAIATVAGDSNCTYAAGTLSVPTGSMTLNLTSAGPNTTPHGTLDATLYVHAPLATDCGPSDTERVVLAF